MPLDMKKLRLSPRLQYFLDQALPGEPLWDFFCDHGLLGRRALQEGLFPEVHFVDRVPGIMKTLEGKLHEENLWGENAHLHLAAAEDLRLPMTGTLVLAGVGADKMLEVLSALHAHNCLQAKRWVLSPHKDESTLPRGLKKIFGESLVIPEPHSMIESGRERPIWTIDHF